MNILWESSWSKIEDSFITQKLNAIGCEIHEKKVLNVIPPTWRQDINIPEDLVEEIGRLFGYHNIESKRFQKKVSIAHKKPRTSKNQKKIKQLLVSRNMFETISWSFTDKKIEDILKVVKTQ